MIGKIMFRHTVCVLLLAAAVLYSPRAYSRSRSISDSRPPARHFTEVKLPRGFHLPGVQSRQLRADSIAIDLYAMTFSQGMAVYAELYPDPPAAVKTVKIKKLLFEDRSIPVSERSWGYRALFGLSPDRTPGSRRLSVEYVADGKHCTAAFSVPVAATRYKQYPGALDLGKYSDIDYRPTPEEERFIDECVRKKKKAFSRDGSDELNSALSHPRDYHFVTSPFYAKRMIMRYRKVQGKKIRHKDKLNVHRGIDLRGKTGETLFAMASGTIAIAEPMYYEGNFIVIDHGNRIFSCYMHCDRLSVRAGERVGAGDAIGRVGSTGLSTAAHLHVSLFLQDVPVDPLSMLVLPIRD
jgi:murein DD-endopeptidase